MDLEDGAVRLRPARPGDDPRIIEACNDPVTSHWLGNLPSPYRASDAQWWRENNAVEAEAGRRVAWIVADPATDDPLGAMDLFSIREEWDAELGYWAHPRARGRGLVTAAAHLAVRHAFTPVARGGLGLVRVQGVVAEGNARSAGVLERVGMRRAGVYRCFVRTRAGLVDGILYDVLSDDVRLSGH